MQVSAEEFSRAIGRLEGKIDSILDALPDHEKRLRALEKWKWTIAGGWLVIGFLFAACIEIYRAGHHG